MNGAHDLGGMMGFGPVRPERDEPVFHAAWERRVLAMNVAAGLIGGWSIDEGRHARENRHPREYLSLSYYALWHAGLAELLVAHGLVGADELAAGRSLRPAEKSIAAPGAVQVLAAVSRRAPYEREPARPAAFRIGERVRAREMNPAGHTRLPRYARGKAGMVERVHGAHVFPDSAAHGRGEDPRWLYGVAFAARELWGEAADPALTVSVDCWEPYLEPA